MADNVAAIRPDVIVSEGKQTFLDTLADAYDELFARSGEPVGVVFAFVTQKGACRTGYHTLGSEEGNALYVCRATIALQADAIQWDLNANS